MAPFSLIMPKVPAHITDGEIARLWGMNPYIRSIQMEPFVENSRRCQRVTVHFDDFKGYGDELREKIINGYYKTNSYSFNFGSGGNYLLESSYLLPCETPQPPRTAYSHMVALQLQDVVRQQAEQIRLLESQLQSQKEYSNDIRDMIIALEAENKLQAEKNKELNHKLAAVIEWCSQPVWKRKFCVISPK